MLNFQVLLSAMHLEDEKYIDGLNITSDVIIINQCDIDEEKEIVRENEDGKKQIISLINSTDRGLSRSRNLAIRNASADICVLCDNDVVYEKDYEEKIISAFEKHEDADIIVFYIKRKEKPVPNFDKEKRMGYLSVLKIFSPEIAFRRESVADIKFDEDFGAGSSKYIMGEENIFLYDALKKRKKIYYVPTKIAELKEVESTWFAGYDKTFFISRGANYCAMSRFFSHFLILQFALRKKELYKDKMSTAKAIKFMYAGRKEYLSR